MYNNKNENYKLFLAGIISESDYFSLCEQQENMNKLNNEIEEQRKQLNEQLNQEIATKRTSEEEALTADINAKRQQAMA